MITTSRAIASATALAAALVIVGCAGSSGDQTPTSSPSPDKSTHTDAPILGDDVEAAWLDEGRMFAIVTRGSSTCVPGRRRGLGRGADGDGLTRGRAELRRHGTGMYE